MSNESEVRNFTVESLRFPGEGSSTQGKSGPKPRPRGVGDGQQVEIPVLPLLVIEKWGRRGISQASSWKSSSKQNRKSLRQIRKTIRSC